MAIDKLKTVYSTGALLPNVKTFFTKINEIIDWINSFNSVQPKIYKALLTQSGTNAPTATVIINTLGGTPTFSYDDVGYYTMTLTGAFTIGKTIPVSLCENYTYNDLDGEVHVRIGTNDINTLKIRTLDTAFTPSDDILNNSPILIEVYQ